MAAAAVWLLVPALAIAQETQTLQGEIVDPAAYLKSGAHGMEAANQTYSAVDGGQTLALLDDASGALYLLLADEPGEDPNELVYDYVNQRLKITGKVYERHGLKGIIASSVTPLEPQAAPAAKTPPAQD